MTPLQLPDDLQKITRWAATWLVSFNYTKTEAFLVSCKSPSNLHAKSTNYRSRITQTSRNSFHKRLYMASPHKNITDKAWTRINVMRKLKFKLDRNSSETIYLTFNRPLLEYGDVLWDNCTQYEKN